MTIDTKDMLNSILASISRIDYIKPEEIPGIDLYMDQVTTFMESHLSASKRHADDKILTKTMINNYAKNDLLPPPVKKKYTKEHLLMLTFIYYFKNILSISDIQVLLGPLTEKYFNKDGEMNLTEIYEEIMRLELKQIDPLTKDIWILALLFFLSNPAEFKKANQAKRIADEVYFFHNGTLWESGPKDNILSAPARPETRQFLDFYGA